MKEKIKNQKTKNQTHLKKANRGCFSWPFRYVYANDFFSCPLTLSHISYATATWDYRNICKTFHAELNGVISLGSEQAGCNFTLIQLHCCISAMQSQICHLLNGWCWIPAEVKRGFPFHAGCHLGICFRTDCMGLQHLTVCKGTIILICHAHLFEFTMSCFRGMSRDLSTWFPLNVA